MPTASQPLHQPLGEIVPDWKEPPPPLSATMHGHHCRLEPLDVPKHSSQLFDAFSIDPHGSSWTYLPYGPFE